MKRLTAIALLLCMSIAFCTVHVAFVPGTEDESIMTLDVCGKAAGFSLDAAPTLTAPVFSGFSPVVTESLVSQDAVILSSVFSASIDKPPTL